MAGLGSLPLGSGPLGFDTLGTSLHAPALRQLFPVKDGVLQGTYNDLINIAGLYLDIAYDNAQLELTDMFPSTAQLLLPSWERIFGLTASGTIAQRQAAVVAKYRVVVNKSGRLTLSFYETLLVSLGHPEAYIIEGANLTFIVADSPFESVLPHPVYNTEELWTIEIHATVATNLRPQFEATFEAVKPAWVLIDYIYF